MALESPLLQLQNYNIDVWELLMIELVKARMKYVMNDFKELCDSWWRWSRMVSGQIHHGRRIISIMTGHHYKKNMRLFPITYENKYFVYGFLLKNNYDLSSMILYQHHVVVNVLDELSKLNNFEFIINDNRIIHDLVKFLYERETQITNDKYIYCSIETQIIALED